MLVVVVYVGWWVFWLIEQLVSALLGALIWLLYAFTGLRHGQAAEDALRRVRG